MQSLLHKVFGPEEVRIDNLTGRVALVTGGTLGIGYQVSRALAHAGCKVVMVSRKQDQGESAVAEIRRETPGADVEWEECDLGNLGQIRSVFSGLRRSLARLDFLVLSAGINANRYALDSDGIERIFGVNCLGHYYVANQLWPRLRKTSLLPGVTGPRVVAVSSSLHQAAPSRAKFASLEDINDPSLGPTELYGRSKLGLILMVRYGLFERVIKPTSDSIYALAVHPGAVNTAMQDQWKDAYPGITGRLISYVSKLAGRDPEQGSYSILWALTAKEIDENHQNGLYFDDPGKLGSESSQACDEKLGADLWQLNEKLVKEKLGDDALIPWDTRSLDS
ncbi:uncharacterized protein UV8b_06478 [Ustilaginoidea virens]|uniref:Uncharacterized protein n=1 Tax=Ustilaginoidea virens TaxID=1159556 RepID=A0A063C4K0_USTVR|nr:uncharacterized protein UV8b_06478 [Ustilaginoidea virens]QUC22237.1 hypothetical protein UV8b_06478 [Ustilaginoidea virens]GAO14078.1 hypothetical protein UVI_02038300 [Ustilaginoidea virens]